MNLENDMAVGGAKKLDFNAIQKLKAADRANYLRDNPELKAPFMDWYKRNILTQFNSRSDQLNDLRETNSAQKEEILSQAGRKIALSIKNS